MARFHGVVGYGVSEETPPGSGKWVHSIVEIPYTGDILRNTRRLSEGESLNDDVSVNNSISIVADEYANHHFLAMKFVDWSGVLWTVDSVEVKSPRLILTLGKVYNGPRSE
jgi:hypothetical protein